MKKALFFITFFFSISFFNLAKADSKSVIINEIMWMGSSTSTADEWIELKNATDFDIDISGWQIDGAGSGGAAIIIPEGKIITANSFFVVSNYSASNSKSILLDEPNYVTTAISLKNEDLKLVLKDKVGNIIDEANAGLGQNLAGNNENKWSQERRKNFGDGAKSADWYTATESKAIKTGFMDLATPGLENSKDLSREILEISKSKSSLREATIEGFVVVLPDTLFDNRIYIFDNKSGVRIYLERSEWPNLKMGDKVKIRGSIKTYYGETEIKVIDDSDIENLVNNENILPFLIKTGEFNQNEGNFVKIIGKVTKTSGNTFYIDDGSGEIKIYVKDELNIDLPDKRVGDSAEIVGIINNWNGEFRLLPRNTEDIKITKQKIAEEIKILPILETKKQIIGTRVKTYGKVIVEPGRLGKTIFYIQDENSGIQIYSWYKDFPVLKLGDFIEVIGEISETGGEIRIKINLASDIIILKRETIQTPQKINIKNANSFLGRLVRVKGTITKSSGNTFYIDDGTGVIKIYIKEETEIKKPKTKKGDIVEIVGIVSMTESGLRILPREQTDFKLVWSKPPKGKVLKASTYKRPQLNQEEVVLEAKKVPQNNNLFYITYAILFLIGSSVLALKNVKLD